MQRYIKVSGETNENEVFKFGYPEPHPILSKYSERREQRQMKTQFSNLTMPSRILSFTKIAETTHLIFKHLFN